MRSTSPDYRSRSRSTAARRSQRGGNRLFKSYNQGDTWVASAAVNYYLKSAPAGDVKISIADAAGKMFRSIDGAKQAGINRVMWNLPPDPPPAAQGRPSTTFGGGRGAVPQPVEAGTYVVTLKVGEKTYTNR